MAGLYYTFPHTSIHIAFGSRSYINILIEFSIIRSSIQFFFEQKHTHSHTRPSHTLAGIESDRICSIYLWVFFSLSLFHFHISRFYSLRCDSPICTLLTRSMLVSRLCWLHCCALCEMWMCSSVYFGFDSPFKLMSFEWDTHMRQAKKKKNWKKNKRTNK